MAAYSQPVEEALKREIRDGALDPLSSSSSVGKLRNSNFTLSEWASCDGLGRMRNAEQLGQHLETLNPAFISCTSFCGSASEINFTPNRRLGDLM
jgi:hypothetical protein